MPGQRPVVCTWPQRQCADTCLRICLCTKSMHTSITCQYALQRHTAIGERLAHGRRGLSDHQNDTAMYVWSRHVERHMCLPDPQTNTAMQCACLSARACLFARVCHACKHAPCVFWQDGCWESGCLRIHASALLWLYTTNTPVWSLLLGVGKRGVWLRGSPKRPSGMDTARLLGARDQPTASSS